MPPGDDIGRIARTARELLAVPADVPGRGPDGTVHRFEDFELDPARHELRRDGEPVHVEPQVFDVLVHLVERAGTLASKNDLLDEVWGDRFVSEAALSSRIAFARKALGDDGTQQRLIRTVHGRGFVFVGTLLDSS